MTNKLIFCPELGGDREDPGFPPGCTVETGWPNRNHTEAELLWLGRLPYTLYEHVLNQMRFAHQGYRNRQKQAAFEATFRRAVAGEMTEHEIRTWLNHSRLRPIERQLWEKRLQEERQARVAAEARRPEESREKRRKSLPSPPGGRLLRWLPKKLKRLYEPAITPARAQKDRFKLTPQPDITTSD